MRIDARFIGLRWPVECDGRRRPVIVEPVRTTALAGTKMARAQCGTVRLKLLKIGALVRVTVRKAWVALAESCPWAGIWRAAWRNLTLVPAPA